MSAVDRGEASSCTVGWRTFETRKFSSDDAANAFMAAEPGWGVIKVIERGEYAVHVAKMDDEGTLA